MEKVAEVFSMYLQLITLFKKKEESDKRKRRWAVRPINRNWHTSGYFTKTFLPMRDMDEEQFFLHTRMPKKLFSFLINLLGNTLRKPRQRISTEERLEITLLFLAHGASLQSIAWSHKLGKTTVWKIVMETCDAIWQYSWKAIVACDKFSFTFESVFFLFLDGPGSTFTVAADVISDSVSMVSTIMSSSFKVDEKTLSFSKHIEFDEVKDLLGDCCEAEKLEICLNKKLNCTKTILKL